MAEPAQPKPKQRMHPAALALLAVAIVLALLVGVWYGLGYIAYYNNARAVSFSMVAEAARGIVVYEYNYGGLPPEDTWADVLEDKGFYPREFRTPNDIADDHDGVMHVYIKPPPDCDRTAFIMLYEDPDHWPDHVYVAFADSTTQRMPKAEFDRRLAEQQADRDTQAPAP